MIELKKRFKVCSIILQAGLLVSGVYAADKPNGKPGSKPNKPD